MQCFRDCFAWLRRRPETTPVVERRVTFGDATVHDYYGSPPESPESRAIRNEEFFQRVKSELEIEQRRRQSLNNFFGENMMNQIYGAANYMEFRMLHNRRKREEELERQRTRMDLDNSSE